MVDQAPARKRQRAVAGAGMTTNEEASEQDKTIARVVLAGWRIDETLSAAGIYYAIFDRDGLCRGSAWTRYTAATKALLWITQGEK